MSAFSISTYVGIVCDPSIDLSTPGISASSTSLLMHVLNSDALTMAASTFAVPECLIVESHVWALEAKMPQQISCRDKNLSTRSMSHRCAG